MLARLRQLLAPRRPDAAVRGSVGEVLAERHLRAAGLKPVTRNWRNPDDEREEIDLVMRDAEVLVFVEVKARGEGALVPGYYAVDRRKKKALLRACEAYLRRSRPVPRHYRFDVVEVELPLSGGEAGAQVRHFSNVPLFPKRFVSG